MFCSSPRPVDAGSMHPLPRALDPEPQRLLGTLRFGDLPCASPGQQVPRWSQAASAAPIQLGSATHFLLCGLLQALGAVPWVLCCWWGGVQFGDISCQAVCSEVQASFWEEVSWRILVYAYPQPNPITEPILL